MPVLSIFVTLGLASAFAPAPAAFRSHSPLYASTFAPPEVDSNGNNLIVKESLLKLESSGLLSDVARSKLLSNAQKSGVTLSKLESLLALADENPDALILLQSAAPEALPLVPKIIETAPALLPLLSTFVAVPPAALYGAALGGLGAAGFIVSGGPADTEILIAAQTLAVAILGVALPAATITAAKVIDTVTE